MSAAVLAGAGRRRVPDRRDGPDPKYPELRDNPPQNDMRWVEFFGQTAMHFDTQDIDWPDIIDAARAIRKVVDEYPERMTVGEVFGGPQNIVRNDGGEELDGLHLGRSTSRSCGCSTSAGRRRTSGSRSTRSRRRCRRAAGRTTSSATTMSTG